jgi:hypothetical protein
MSLNVPLLIIALLFPVGTSIVECKSLAASPHANETFLLSSLSVNLRSIKNVEHHYHDKIYKKTLQIRRKRRQGQVSNPSNATKESIEHGQFFEDISSTYDFLLFYNNTKSQLETWVVTLKNATIDKEANYTTDTSLSSQQQILQLHIVPCPIYTHSVAYCYDGKYYNFTLDIYWVEDESTKEDKGNSSIPRVILYTRTDGNIYTVNDPADKFFDMPNSSMLFNNNNDTMFDNSFNAKPTIRSNETTKDNMDDKNFHDDKFLSKQVSIYVAVVIILSVSICMFIFVFGILKTVLRIMHGRHKRCRRQSNVMCNDH